jgi:hypothetical protein
VYVHDRSLFVMCSNSTWSFGEEFETREIAVGAMPPKTYHLPQSFDERLSRIAISVDCPDSRISAFGAEAPLEKTLTRCRFSTRFGIDSRRRSSVPEELAFELEGAEARSKRGRQLVSRR